MSTLSILPPQDNTPSAQTIEAMFADSGVDMDAITAEVAQSENAKRSEVLQGLQKEQDSLTQKVMENGAEAIKAVGGIGVGIGDILTNIYNGAVSLSDGFAKYTSENPANFQASAPVENPLTSGAFGQGEINEGDLGTGGDITRAITNFAGPMVAAVATGGSVAAGMGVNAAYNFLAIDPKSQRLSDHLKDTWVEDVPLAADMIDYLSTKPDDTELDSRFKNMVEGFGLDVALGGMLWGASRAYANISRLRDPAVVEATAEGVARGKEALESAATKVEATPVTQAESAALDASDEAISSAPAAISVEERAAQEAASVAQFNKEYPSIMQDPPPFNENGSPNPGSGDFLQRMGALIREGRTTYRDIGPISDAEIAAASKAMPQERIEALAKWKPGDAIPPREEIMALQVMEYRAAEDFSQRVAALSDDATDGQLLAMSDEFENLLAFSKLNEGIGTEQGRSFRLRQVLTGVAGKEGDEVLRDMGEMGRAELVKKVMQKNGGTEKLRERMAKIKMISKFPDSSFQRMVKETAKKQVVYGTDGALTKIAMNGMLSSPTTWGKAFLGNMVTTGKTVVDNYVEASLPYSAKTYEEANAHLMASLSAMVEGVRPAWQAFKTKGASNAIATRLDLGEAGTISQGIEDVAEKAEFRWASREGLVQILTAGELPRRVLIAADTYAQHITSSGVIASEAVRFGREAGLVGEELTNFISVFRENPTAAVENKAKLIASTNTMAKELDGNFAKLQEWIEDAASKVPGFKVFIPFTKTSLNVIEYGVMNSPFAPMMPEFRRAVLAGGRERDEMLAKVASSTAGVTALAFMNYAGLVKGEDSTLAQYKVGRALEGSVPKGAALKVGDKWVEIPRGLAPLTPWINSAAMLNKAAGFLPEEEYDSMAMSFRAAVVSAFDPDGFTRGISTMLEMLDPDSRANLGDVAANFATSFVPMSGALRTIRNNVDTIRRDVKAEAGNNFAAEFNTALQNRLRNVIPGMSQHLPPLRNLWGQELETPAGLSSISPLSVAATGDLELKKTFEAINHYYQENRNVIPGLARVPVEMPERRMNNPMANRLSYEFTPQEYSTFVQLNAGLDPRTGEPLNGMKPLREQVADTLQRYDAIGKNPVDIDPVQYQTMTAELNRTFLFYRQQARSLILNPAYGDVAKKMKDQRDQYMNAGTEVAGGGQ